MITFKLFLESTYKAQDGESEILHHVSPHNFNEFKPFSHFGSKATVRHFKNNYLENDTKTSYSVRLKLGNIAHVEEDESGEHHPINLINQLRLAGHITNQEHNTLHNIYKNSLEGNHKERRQKSIDHFDHLSKWLNNKGIHTISYNNVGEIDSHQTEKDRKSYIITHPSQVRILKKF
jgi:hypothetical protein